jgi:hypothetical protein
MNIRRAGRLLLELLYPLYGLASTPQRRRYWRNLPIRRAAKLFGAVFFFLSGVAFFVDLVMAGSFPLGYLLLLAGLLRGLHVVLVWIELRRPRLLPVPMLMIVLLYLAASQLPKHSRILLSPAGRQR